MKIKINKRKGTTRSAKRQEQLVLGRPGITAKIKQVLKLEEEQDLESWARDKLNSKARDSSQGLRVSPPCTHTYLPTTHHQEESWLEDSTPQGRHRGQELPPTGDQLLKPSPLDGFHLTACQIPSITQRAKFIFDEGLGPNTKMINCISMMHAYLKHIKSKKHVINMRRTISLVTGITFFFFFLLLKKY